MIGFSKLLAFVPMVHLMLSSVSGHRSNAMMPAGGDLPKGCRRQMDFSLVVDESGSIKEKEWATLIPFLEQIIRSLDLDNSDIRLSITTFSTPVRTIITFLDRAASSTRLALEKLEEMKKTKPGNGMTYTGHGLNFVRKAVLPYGRKNVPKAVLIITDGGSTDPAYTAQMAAMLRDEGVYVMVIGVGDVNIPECRGMVGCDGVMDCPMFKHTNWGGIIGVFSQFMTEVCLTLPSDAVCQPVWSPWSECTAECNSSGTRTRSVLRLDTVTKATYGTNGQQGRTCQDQLANYAPQSEHCTYKCPTTMHTRTYGRDTPAPPVTARTADIPDATVATRPAPTPAPENQFNSDGPQGDKPSGDSGHNSDYNPGYNSDGNSDYNPGYNSDGNSDGNSEEPTTPTAPITPPAPEQQDKPDYHHSADPTQKHGEYDEDSFHDDDDHESPLGPTHHTGGSSNDPEPRNGGQVKLRGDMNPEEEDGDDRYPDEEDMDTKWEEEERKARDVMEELKRAVDAKQRRLAMLHAEMDSTQGGVAEEGTATPPLATGGTNLQGEAALTGSADAAAETPYFPEASTAEAKQTDGEAKTEESTRRSSNTTKIAGGAVLGLLLLGAGGGYAMYKKTKAPTIAADAGDYAGADESAQPMKDAETYTVTEFDNNIWGEATPPVPKTRRNRQRYASASRPSPACSAKGRRVGHRCEHGGRARVLRRARRGAAGNGAREAQTHPRRRRACRVHLAPRAQRPSQDATRLPRPAVPQRHRGRPREAPRACVAADCYRCFAKRQSDANTRDCRAANHRDGGSHAPPRSRRAPGAAENESRVAPARLRPLEQALPHPRANAASDGEAGGGNRAGLLRQPRRLHPRLQHRAGGAHAQCRPARRRSPPKGGAGPRRAGAAVRDFFQQHQTLKLARAHSSSLASSAK
ncbi:thrombospondin-related anonymous protein [Babesia caballi]|uniref:Thrombospondin-related anonymous protein n=1 Tax=Babesia caballi TaxID=5871 RepID=A0AAV4LY55_BABCB|nr:thrombospondin-related anonymous protein [Babesia caballi]